MIIPNDQHPGVDYNLEKCSANQNGRVWMLSDVVAKGDATYTKVEFSCQVPEGNTILFPISTESCWLNIPEFDHSYRSSSISTRRIALYFFISLTNSKTEYQKIRLGSNSEYPPFFIWTFVSQVGLRHRLLH